MIRNSKLIGPVNPTDYHNETIKRGDPKFVASNSMLVKMLKCPKKWLLGAADDDTVSRDWGSLVDTLLLTPEQFKSRYAITPATYESTGMKCPTCESVTDSKKCARCKCDRVEVKVQKEWTNQSDTCQQWVEDQRKAGMVVVSKGFFDAAIAAAKEAQADELVAKFIASSDRQVMLIAEWHDPDTGLVIPLKAMLDLVPRYDTSLYKNLGDLKTTRNAALENWAWDAKKHLYHQQAAFYMDIYKAAMPKEDRCNFCFLVQENEFPYITGRRILGEKAMSLGRARYRHALKSYCQFLKTGRFPDYDQHEASVGEGWSVWEIDERDEQRFMFEVKHVPLIGKSLDEIEGDEENHDVTP